MNKFIIFSRFYPFLFQKDPCPTFKKDGGVDHFPIIFPYRPSVLVFARPKGCNPNFYYISPFVLQFWGYRGQRGPTPILINFSPSFIFDSPSLICILSRRVQFLVLVNMLVIFYSCTCTFLQYFLLGIYAVISRAVESCFF